MKIQPPIFYLRNGFQKSLRRLIDQESFRKIEELIAINLTPTDIKGDFTFPIFEIAKKLKINYFKLATDIVKNLTYYKKYIRKVEIINGYINIIIEPDTFYGESLKYVLNENLLQDTKKYKNIKKVLFIFEQMQTDLLINQPVFRFINRLYALPPYLLKTASISEAIPPKQTQTFLQKMARAKKVEDFGNNVIAIQLPERKKILLQKQNMSPTTILSQLTNLNINIRKNNPSIIIFPPNIVSQSTDQLLEIADKLQIFKEGTKIIVIDNSDIENKLNSYHFKILKDLYHETGKILKDGIDINFKKPIEFKDTEYEIARFISYAPEVFRRSLIQASPKDIINNSEICKNHLSELYQFTKNINPPQEDLPKQLLLHAIYKILNASLELFEFQQSPLK